MSLDAIYDEWMRIEDVAARLRIHPQSVRRLRQHGRLRQRRLGRFVLFRRADVERFALTYTGRPGRSSGARRLL